MEPKGVSAVSLAGVAAPIAALFLAGLANGQTVANASGQLLTPVTVEATLPNNILPTSTDFSDAFGLDLPVTEIPRSISVITKEELQNNNIETARDFARISSDTYTPYFNGNPSSVYILGQVADTFFNGIRIGFTSEGVSKASAMRTIADQYGVDLRNVMYIGDSGNDLPALRIVGHPIAMANASPAVIAV